MAKVCDICNKGKLFGNTVSHSHRRGNRTWTPNLKKVRAVVNGSHVTLNVCTKCIRSGKLNSI
jgi:large subunit ribosomal protein L28